MYEVFECVGHFMNTKTLMIVNGTVNPNGGITYLLNKDVNNIEHKLRHEFFC